MALKMDARLFASVAVVVVLNLFVIVPRSCDALRPIKIGESNQKSSLKINPTYLHKEKRNYRIYSLSKNSVQFPKRESKSKKQKQKKEWKKEKKSTTNFQRRKKKRYEFRMENKRETRGKGGRGMDNMFARKLNFYRCRDKAIPSPQDPFKKMDEHRTGEKKSTTRENISAIIVTHPGYACFARKTRHLSIPIECKRQPRPPRCSFPVQFE